jgi:hypothetical protein
VLFLLKMTRGLRAAPVFCLLAVAILSCAAQDAAPTYPVKGIVLDKVSHQPIARALVSANDGDAVLTDNDGHFELTLPAGTTLLSYRRPGYGGRERAASRSVKVGADMPDLTLYLTPNAIITGHVTLSSGDEAGGIRIMAYRRRVVNGREAWTMQASATTNSEGAFRIGDLTAPASYLLYSMPVHERVGLIAPGATGYGYPSVYYPGVSDLAAAGVLTLSEGQQAQADFTLTRQIFYPVSIAIPDHQRGRGVQIHDMSGRPLEMSTRWNAELGQAQINLPNGRYYAEVRSFGETQAYGRVDFTVAGGPVSGLTMAMLPLRSIPVQIHDDFTAGNGNGNQGFLYAGPPTDAGAGLTLQLRPVEAFEQGGNTGIRHVEGSSDASLYEVPNLVPGTYWATTYAFQGYVSSITSGGVDLAREPLTVGVGNSTAPIEITVRNDGIKISGQLNQSASSPASAAGSGAPTAFIYAIPLFPTSSPVPQTELQSSSQFTFSNLAPGAYHVIALDEATEIDPTDAQALAKYAGKGQTVTVEANGEANVQLDLIETNGEAATP